MVIAVALGAFACAPASSSDDENAQGALTGESAATAKVRFGTFEYRYPGRDGLVKRLFVLKEGAEGAVGTFERTEWKKEGRRLATRKTTGTFTTSTKPMPEFTRTLLHFKTGDGQVETYRYRNDDDGRLQLQINREGAPRTEVRLVEAADGTKALVGDCKATAVDDMTIFEESFSVDQYPCRRFLSCTRQRLHRVVDWFVSLQHEGRRRRHHHAIGRGPRRPRRARRRPHARRARSWNDR